MADPFDELGKQAAALSREEKVAAFRAAKDHPSRLLLPDSLWKPTTDELIKKGLDRIRMARRARVAVWVAIVIGSIVVTKFDIPISSDIYAIASLVMLGLMEVLLLSLRCPRCGFKFISLDSRKKTFTRTCSRCGLSLDEGLRPFFW